MQKWATHTYFNAYYIWMICKNLYCFNTDINSGKLWNARKVVFNIYVKNTKGKLLKERYSQTCTRLRELERHQPRSYKMKSSQNPNKERGGMNK